jgi:primosomal replication protein N
VEDNRVFLRARLVELDALRYTPAGVPMVKFRVSHQSSQEEAGTLRKVDCELAAVAFETEAKLLAAAQLGSAVGITGFLDRSSRRSQRIVLHATHIEFE